VLLCLLLALCCATRSKTDTLIRVCAHWCAAAGRQWLLAALCHVLLQRGSQELHSFKLVAMFA
jgi:ABC-type transport system involved in cytochrome c biogenesis permease component